MIPQQSTMQVIDTLPGEETEFTISDPRWVMRSLADLYSIRELAVVREYSTNARDAMIEAGNADKPIEVTLPSLMNPYFKVRDYGVGMSESTLRDVYTKFGSSTKRDSNDFNGMLGFGSKSAVAYTNTFTITAVKDGIKTVGVINRKPDYSIVLKVVMVSKTDEPNGVEVSVPVHNHEHFASVARNFYRFWLPGTVLVNGKEPVHEVGDKISDNLYYSGSGTSYVVMGNVPYRINNPAALFANAKVAQINFVAYVPNGSVEFTPNREDLKYSDLTKATLQKVISDFETKMVTESRKQIENAPNHIEAWKAWHSWTGRLGAKLFAGIEYRGEKIPDVMEIVGMKYTIRDGVHYSRYNTERILNHALVYSDKTLVVTHFDKTLTSHDKGRVRSYANHVGLNVRYAIFVTGDFESKWFDKSRVISWENLKAALPRPPKQPRAYGGYTRQPKTWDIVTRAGRRDEQPLPSGTVYYARIKDYNDLNLPTALDMLDDNGSIILLAANRVDKFTRDNPNAKDFVEYAKSKVVLDGLSMVPDDVKALDKVGGKVRSYLRDWDASKIDDPDWTKMAEVAKNREQSLAEYSRYRSLAFALGMGREFKAYRSPGYYNDGKQDMFIKRYPLIDSYTVQSALDDVYLYMNAKYALTKGKK